jgi:hypothetical protein
MSIYVILAYADECRLKGIEPSWQGLKLFKNAWSD